MTTLIDQLPLDAFLRIYDGIRPAAWKKLIASCSCDDDSGMRVVRIYRRDRGAGYLCGRSSSTANINKDVGKLEL